MAHQSLLKDFKQISKGRIVIKIIKLTPQIGTADKERKLTQAKDFLIAGEQVQLQVQLRGRQKAHPDRAVAMLQGIADDLGELSRPANTPTAQRLSLTLNPKKR